MKRSQLAIFGLISALLFSSLVNAKDWSDIYKKSTASIPIISHMGALCSGSLIAPDTTLTAAHCVDRLYNVYVRFDDKEYPADVIFMRRSNDLAILKHAPVKDIKTLKIIDEKEVLEVGEELATIGHPSPATAFGKIPFMKDFTYLMSTGILSKKTKREIISDMSMSPGNSGGPVFNSKGEIVGVVSRKRVDMGVGAIGLSTNHKEIHAAIKKANKSKAPLGNYRAKSNLYTNLSYSFFNQSDENVALKDFNLGTFDIGFTFNSRWDILWKLKLHEPNGLKDFLDFRVYYRKAYELKGHSYLFVSPFISSLKIAKRHVNGLGLKFSHSIIPMGISFTKFTSDEVAGDLSAIELHFGATF